MNRTTFIVALCGTAVLAAACGSGAMPGVTGSAGTAGGGLDAAAGGSAGNEAMVVDGGGEGGGDSPMEAGPKTVVAMVTIPATANLFGAGHATLPAPGGGGAGTPPILVMLPPGTQRKLTFTNVSGTVDMDGPGDIFGPMGADGLLFAPEPIPGGPSLYGIGTLSTDRILFLAGVFLDDTEPMDPGPMPYIVDHTLTDIDRKLQEAVFVGDGLNVSLDGKGAVQTFHIPDGATRFYLGFADFAGPGEGVGSYDENTGQILATVTVTY